MLKVKKSKELLVEAKRRYLEQLKSHKKVMEELDVIVLDEDLETLETDVGLLRSKRPDFGTCGISQGTQRRRRLKKTKKGAHKKHNIMTQCQTILKKLMNHKLGYQVSAN